MQNKIISITDFENSSDEEIKKYVQKCEKEDIVDLLYLIRRKRAVKWEDRAILQMVEKSPLTFWASNKAYRIVLWKGMCEEVYNRNLKGEPFPEIMSIYERSHAMEDSISVIDADEKQLGQLLADFRNYYTKDMQGAKTGFSLVTNSMQLINDETGEKFYAEIGLPIDLEKAIAEHEDRQKDFEKCVNSFNDDVQSLREKFTKGIDLLRKRVNEENNLSANQKASIRRLIKSECSVINGNLKKSARAFDFEIFLQDNEEAIETSLSKIDVEIGKAIKKEPVVQTNEIQEDPEKLKVDVSHMTEIVELSFNSEIQRRINVEVTSEELRAERDSIIKALQEERDKYLRELTEMNESLASSPEYALSLYRIRLKSIGEKTQEKSSRSSSMKGDKEDAKIKRKNRV